MNEELVPLIKWYNFGWATVQSNKLVDVANHLFKTIQKKEKAKATKWIYNYNK